MLHKCKLSWTKAFALNHSLNQGHATLLLDMHTFGQALYIDYELQKIGTNAHLKDETVTIKTLATTLITFKSTICVLMVCWKHMIK